MRNRRRNRKGGREKEGERIGKKGCGGKKSKENTLPKARRVSEGGRWSTGRQNWFPKEREVREGGRWSTYWEKDSPKVSERREGGRE